MANKYSDKDKKQILDIHTSFGDIWAKDVMDVWKKEHSIGNIQDLICYRYYQQESGKIIDQSFIDGFTLILFGEKLLKDSLLDNVNYYKLVIPSESVYNGLHSVALMLDHKNKNIKYHDPHGVDMRREIKDFMGKLFPDYKINVDFTKQQDDIVSATDSNKNDNSCSLLSLYNLRDMWFEQKGMKDKVQNFNSVSARQDVVKILSNIQKPQTQEKKHLFSFGKKKVESVNQEEQQSNNKELFEYRLYKEPNYNEIIDRAVKIAREKFEIWQNEQLFQQNVMRIGRN
ncbi:MAG: hypothetical protein IKZ49_04735 [Alphaproteobacteria bacterium]|nr:hypothetical protein [Alphaproteobacteria bacterium]